MDTNNGEAGNVTETGVSHSEETPRHTIYTLGYGIEARESHAASNQLASFLRGATAGLIIDVRLTPSSRIPGWDLEDLLKGYGLHYLHLTELGNLHHHSSQPIKLVDEESGLAQLESWLEQFDILLLCGCYQVEQCHRGYIAGRLAARTQAPVCHLLQAHSSQQTKPTPRPPRRKNEPTAAQSGLRTIELWGPGEL